MLRLLVAALPLLALAAPAAGADRRYPVADFERVVVEGPYNVRLTVGGSSSAVVSGSPRALDAVSVEVQGRTLRIRRNGNAWGSTRGPSPEPATIILTTRTLRSAGIIGSGMLRVSNARGLRVDLSVEGSGQLVADGLAVDNLALGLRGSGSLTVRGTAETLAANVQGTGSLIGAELSAENATVSAATAGEVSLTVRSTATVSANGIGGVTISGTPACTISGPAAAGVRCGR